MTQPTQSLLPAAWREFGAYLRHPAQLTPSGLGSKAARQTVALMAALHIAVLGALLILLTAWQELTGISGPSAFDQVPREWLVPIAVIAAPVIEEAAFRGWFSGRPRAFWLLGSFFALIAGLILLDPRSGLILLALALLVIPGVWFWLRKRTAPGWFTGKFAGMFYASAAVFALVHVVNYSSPGLLHLPMVLPQLWAGLTLGFLRMKVGLPAAMLVHGASNALALAIATSVG